MQTETTIKQPHGWTITAVHLGNRHQSNQPTPPSLDSTGDFDDGVVSGPQPLEQHALAQLLWQRRQGVVLHHQLLQAPWGQREGGGDIATRDRVCR